MMDIALPFPMRRETGSLWKNMGGPRSRTRSETIRSSLLGARPGAIRCPMIRQLGIELEEGTDPVAEAYGALARLGFTSPEELRTHYKVPERPCVVAPSLRLPLLEWRQTSDEILLNEALLLGLCTKVAYDPRRPVLWTRASLTRQLELFQTGGFYALD